MAGDAPITEILEQWSRGEAAALDRLLPIVHNELRELARRRMHAMPAGHVLQPTALVNEVYLRLVGVAKIDWQDRAHFFAIAAKMMRHIAVDEARARGRAKRGGGWRQVDLDAVGIVLPAPDEQVVELDEALGRLAELDERKARVVEMRFFGGLTNDEIAQVLKVSVDTVKRDWSFSKLWLASELGCSR